MREVRTLGEGLLKEERREAAGKSLGSVDIMATLLSRNQAATGMQYLGLPVEIQVGANWVQKTALVDSGVSLNFISHLLARELNLCINTAPQLRVTTLRGQTLSTYRRHKAVL